jgi:hypothetical protein
LKSTGPLMTVEQIKLRTEEEVDIACVWFETNRQVLRDTFPSLALDKVAKRD